MLRKVELCELFAQKTGNWVSRTALCRYLHKLGINRKKKTVTVAKPRLLSPKIKRGVWGKNQRYRAGEPGIFG